MKRIPILLLALASLSLGSCITVTETRPDGTVIKTQGIDRDSVIAVSTAATTLGGAYFGSQHGGALASGKQYLGNLQP